MKRIFPIIIIALLASCNSSADSDAPSLCDCVEAGAEADRISASLFHREHTQEAKDSLDSALEARDRLCLPYQHMLAHDLQEKAAECESLKFSVEEGEEN